MSVGVEGGLCIFCLITFTKAIRGTTYSFSSRLCASKSQEEPLEPSQWGLVLYSSSQRGEVIGYWPGTWDAGSWVTIQQGESSRVSSLAAVSSPAGGRLVSRSRISCQPFPELFECKQDIHDHFKYLLLCLVLAPGLWDRGADVCLPAQTLIQTLIHQPIHSSVFLHGSCFNHSLAQYTFMCQLYGGHFVYSDKPDGHWLCLLATSIS